MRDIYNIQIERALLASILFDPKLLNDIEDIIDNSDFGYKSHNIIFSIMSDLNRRDLPVNEDFIRKNIPKGENLDNDIFEIVATAPIVGAKSYAQEIKDLSLKRKLHHLANTIKEQSLELNTPSIEIINSIESKVFNLQINRVSKGFREFKETALSMLRGIEKQKVMGNEALIGIDTGFKELNHLTAGLKEGELVVLAARPAMGKTAFAINLIQPTLKENKAVAFFSLEMDAEQIALRMFSSMTSIPLQNLRIGDLSDNDWHYFSNMCDKSSSWKLYIDDGGGLNISQLRSKIRRLKLKEPSLSLIVIDYLQIMSGINNKDRHLEIAEISRGLKNLAREIRIPILALSQLNRMLEARDDRRPQLSDLRESGAIEQDADIILFLYRDDVYKRKDQKARIAKARKEGKKLPEEEILKEQDVEEVELIIGKHRNGPTGTIKLNMHTKFTRFADANTYNIEEQSETKMIDDMIPL
ncbi:MAG: replicative DNA helicase [Helicobacteraceae bacterium]|nr:replicative DNA helicase [Helicobacteraceae bacterium]